MTTRVPVPGDPFVLDGLVYVVGPSKLELIDAGERAELEAQGYLLPAPVDNEGHTAVLTQRFDRPAAADPLEAATHRANFNWKKAGKAYQLVFRWVTREEYLAMAQRQADQLMAGAPRPEYRLWAVGSMTVLKAQALQLPDEFWCLPGRGMIKIPCLPKDGDWEPVAPTSVAHAIALAEGILDHTLFIPKEG